MNTPLLKEIVSHIYANFALIHSDFVNLEKTSSLMTAPYLLSQQINFEAENTQYHGKMWGCQMSLAQHHIKILLVDCSIDPGVQELAMVVQSKNAPVYGLYLLTNPPDLDPASFDPMLAVSPDDGKAWMSCNAGLQGTFLAAMEQVRDLHVGWEKCTDYHNLHQAMVSFLKFVFTNQ